MKSQRRAAVERRRDVQSRTMLLDGGMGHQLKRMGVEISGEVGTMCRFLGVAMANTENPKLVRDAHLAFIDAGCDVITTNNYSVVPNCLKLSNDFPGDESGREAELRRLVAVAGQIAAAARAARPKRNVRVAGCLPPLNESYRADRVDGFEENLKHYRLIAQSMAPYANVLLCETMSTAEEARAAATAAAETSLPVWVSWTLDCDSGGEPVLRSGETLGAALEALGAPLRERVSAFLFNCSSPEVISRAVPLMRALCPPGASVGGYGNGFVTAKSGSGEYRLDLGPEQYWGEYVRQWIGDGLSAGDTTVLPADGTPAVARPQAAPASGSEGGVGGGVVVGGCCGIFPEHIAQIRAGIDSKHSRF